MSRLARLTAALPLCALLASPATAQQFFDFTLTVNFAAVGPGESHSTSKNVTPVINGTTVDKDFVLTGRTTTALSATPWQESNISAPIDVDSLALTYGGEVLPFTPYTGLWTFGTQGNSQTNEPPVFSFGESNGVIDLRANTIQDSLVLQTSFGDVATWLGFGGATTVPGSTDGSRRWGITIDSADDVVQFGDNEILGRIAPQDGRSQRDVSLVPEIDGSAFAYIAFILGALALWLHSGAGRREPDERLA